jgi:glutathione S-transferase
MIAFYYGSGSPYAWRVWLALEQKRIPYELKLQSFSSGDLKTPEYLAINPRGRVPAIRDDGFALFESVAIMEYLDEAYDSGVPLYPGDAKRRATMTGPAIAAWIRRMEALPIVETTWPPHWKAG